MIGFGLKKKLRIAGYRLVCGLEPIFSCTPNPTWQPTFVIGPPRSGTTIVLQAIDSAFTLSYFSRIAVAACLITGSPKPATSSILTLLARKLPRKRHRFENSFGRSQELHSPTESEIIWDKLFGNKHDYVDPDSINASQRETVRRVVATTEARFDSRPFIDKSTTASIRIEALRSIFPDALFIRVVRDRIAVAQSILIARRQRRFKDWIGARPVQCVDMQNELIEKQVCAQVYYTERAIDDAVDKIGTDPFLTITYSDLCANPAVELRRVAEFWSRHGVQATAKDLDTDQFTESTGRKVADEQYDAIVREFTRLSEADGH